MPVGGGTGTVVTPPANQAPTVSFIAPAAGASVTINQALQLVATAADDVSVTSVKFLNGATSLGMGVKNGTTYSLSYTPTTTGSLTLSAKATDGAGLSTTASVTVTAAPVGSTTPAAPTVSFDGNTRVLSWSHALGASELEYAQGVGAYQQYTAGLSIDDNAHAAGEWKARVKAYVAGNRNASQQPGYCGEGSG
ncbi:Ig-like domain-containing protein [Hymenobacter cellulosilyticus]|uniref:Ig-like domain-containing protein n=1 Tax=Hymenobacter cellulosilyticus TaxID=2932248 RepID=A0A8T9Q5B1_9BACT|nr:Ig-like domain-containing protein [Hymenobacter cellulosilyticus]UOQ70970.1 Ig-like domain-containing protein [Hymenobacter cellulosilyticus]